MVMVMAIVTRGLTVVTEDVDLPVETPLVQLLPDKDIEEVVEVILHQNLVTGMVLATKQIQRTLN